MKLYANTAIGVTYDGDDSIAADVVFPDRFFEKLATLKDDEYICCECGPEMVKKIDLAYGIR